MTSQDATFQPPLTLARRSPKSAREKVPSPVVRFFLGDATEATVTLREEVKTENEAVVRAFQTGQPYFRVEAWQAHADLSGESIAVRKGPVMKT